MATIVDGKMRSGELKDNDQVVVDVEAAGEGIFAKKSEVDTDIERINTALTNKQDKLTFDNTPTAGSSNPVTSDGIKQAIAAGSAPADYDAVKAQVQQNTQNITSINEKIPAQASAQNQLADKAFVNSSIASNTATFRGTYNLVTDLGLTVSATQQQTAAAIATHLASLVPPVVPDNNDYVFVQVPSSDEDPTVINRVDRYKCNVTESGGVTTRAWEYEWSLNNSSFTADQWAAINSGITSGDVEKLNGIETGAQVNIIDTVKVNGTAITPDANKAVDITVPVQSVNTKTGAVVLKGSDIEVSTTDSTKIDVALGNKTDKTTEELHDARNLRDLIRMYTLWEESIAANDRAGGYYTIYFTPTVFGATANCIVREVTVRSSDTQLPTNQDMYAKLIDPDNTSIAMVVSRPVRVVSRNTDYTFVFDTDAVLTYNKQYYLVFYAGAQDGASPMNFPVRLTADLGSVQAIYYGAFTQRRPITKFKFSDTTDKEVKTKADTAYQKPSGGIPDSDLSSGVQTSLGKADTAYQMPSGGVPKTDLSSGVQASLDKADTALQTAPVTSVNTKTGAVVLSASDVGALPSSAASDFAPASLSSEVAGIEAKIPTQASAENQLADKSFVNSSIATNTANFLGTFDYVTDLGFQQPSSSADVSNAAIATALGSLTYSQTPTNNDYVFVQIDYSTTTPADEFRRFKFNGTAWSYEYTLNNSSFTASQWAAINSGITSGDVAKLGALPTAQELAAALLAKYEKPSGGIPKSDLTSDVQTSLGKADSAIQTVKVNGSALTPDENKSVDVTVPVKATTVPVIAGTAAIGDSAKFAAENHVHPAETKVLEYSLPDECFPITYTDNQLPSGQQSRTIASNDGIRFVSGATYVILNDIAGEAAGGYLYGFSYFELNTSTNKMIWNSCDAPIENLKFNGVSPVINTSPVLEKDTVFVRDVQVAKPSDIPVTSVNNKTGAVVLDASDVGAEDVDNKVTSLSAQSTDTQYPSAKCVYDAIQQGGGSDKANSAAIAPEFSSSSTYAVGDVVMHEGLRYKCSTAVSTAGDWNSANWTLEPVQTALGSITPGPDNTKANSTALAPNWRAGNVDTEYPVNYYITYNGNAYVCMAAYTATSSSPTPNNDIYDDTVTPATGHWKLTDMTTPDATLDITSAGGLRVVSADGSVLWQQGYDLKTTSSATQANEAVNKYDFAANATANVSLTLPTPPTGKVGDFVLDVTNPALDTASFTQSAFSDAATYAVGDEVIYDSKIWRCVTAVSTAGAWTGTTNWEEAHPYFSIAGLSSTVEMVVPAGENLSEILTFAPGTRCELYFTLTSFNVNSHPTWKVVRQDVEVVAS